MAADAARLRVPPQGAAPAPPPTAAHCWRFSPQALVESPSRADGVTLEEEASLRRGGVAHILEMAARGFQDGCVRRGAGRRARACQWQRPAVVARHVHELARTLHRAYVGLLDSPNSPSHATRPPACLPPRSKDRAPATAAAVLFNRFFARQSFARFDRWLVATAAFLTSCKVEEGHRKVRDVLAMSLRARYGSGSRKGALPDPAGPEFAALRDRLTDMERQLLHALQFDVAVELPFATVTGTLLRWRDGGSLGRRDEAGAVASQLDRAACGIAQALAVSEAGLLFTGPEIGACSLWLAWRHLRAGGGLPPALARQDMEDALFFGSAGGGGGGSSSSSDDGGGGGLIRDRRLAAGVLQCYRAMVALRLEDDEHLRAAAAARLAAAGQRAASASAGGGTSGNVTPYAYAGSSTPGPLGGATSAASGGGGSAFLSPGLGGLGGGAGSAGHGSAAFSAGGAGATAEGTTPSGLLGAVTGVTGGGGSAPPTGLSVYGSSSAAAVPSPSLVGAAPQAAAPTAASLPTFAAAGGVLLTAVAPAAASVPAAPATTTAPAAAAASGGGDSGLSALMARMRSMVQQTAAAPSAAAPATSDTGAAAPVGGGGPAPPSSGAIDASTAAAQPQPQPQPQQQLSEPSLLPAAGTAAATAQASGAGAAPSGPGFHTSSSSSSGALRQRSLSSGVPALPTSSVGVPSSSLIAAMTAAEDATAAGGGGDDVAMTEAPSAAAASADAALR
jgi:hypothetical protein